MRNGNLFEDIPATLADERFDTLLETNALKLERIVSRGHATPDGQWYDQPRDEWVLLLKGRAAIVIQGQQAPVAMSPGDHLLLPARCRHRVAWTDPEVETVWLALHFSEK